MFLTGTAVCVITIRTILKQFHEREYMDYTPEGRRTTPSEASDVLGSTKKQGRKRRDDDVAFGRDVGVLLCCQNGTGRKLNPTGLPTPRNNDFDERGKGLGKKRLLPQDASRISSFLFLNSKRADYGALYYVFIYIREAIVPMFNFLRPNYIQQKDAVLKRAHRRFASVAEELTTKENATTIFGLVLPTSTNLLPNLTTPKTSEAKPS